MFRENGFINLDNILNTIGVDTSSLDSIMKSDKITVINGSNSNVFSFIYNNTRFYFKTNEEYNLYNYYAELLAEELAKDFGIPCALYDLAKVGNHYGVISKDIKKEGATYVDIEDIIGSYHEDLWDNFSLINIWDDLNKYYRNRDDREKIVSKLISKIVDKFIFDVLICQLDSSNMMIMECDGKVSLAPIFDNELMQYEGKEFAFYFGVDEKIVPVDNYPALSVFNRFLSISSKEYVNRVVDKMWVIGDANLAKKFEIIERRTNYPVPENIKSAFLNRFTNYRNMLVEILNKNINNSKSK